MPMTITLPEGFTAAACAVFLLGLRHGADPDHLAAIDNVTRNGLSTQARVARFAGALFAGGHSAVVLAIAALAGLLGERVAAHGQRLEAHGGWLSIATLLALAALNVRQLCRRSPGRPVGIKTALLPRALRASTSPLAAVPIGMLFGLGFDTSSQIAAYGLAFASSGGVMTAIVLGVFFSVGMAVTDTLDSLLVFRLCSLNPAARPRASRLWLTTVTALALLIAIFETAGMVGWRPDIPDLAVSTGLVSSLIAVFLISRWRGLQGRDQAAPSPRSA